MRSLSIANQYCLVNRSASGRPVGSLAGRRRFGLPSWRDCVVKVATSTEGHAERPARQDSKEAAREAAAASQLTSHSSQQAQQHGLDPKRVFQQPDLRAVLSLLQSVPPQQLGGAALAAALVVVFKLRGRQLKHGPPAEGAAEEAAAQSIVQLGWQQLSSLPAAALVPLLLATLSVTVPTKTLVVAWVSAMQACNGLRELFPLDRAGLLHAAHKLAIQSEGELYLPRAMLMNNLARLTASDRAARVSLHQLALVYAAIHGLGLWLTSERQAALDSAVVQHLGPDKPAYGVPLTQILTTWVEMEPLHVAWRAKQGNKSNSRLNRQQEQAGGRQEQSQQAWPALWAGTAVAGQGRHQQQQQRQPHDPGSGIGLGLARDSTTEFLEVDEMGSAVGSYDGITCRPPSGYPGRRALSAIVSHCHAHREELGSWSLGQLLGALGALQHAPPPAILADLVEAFLSKLQGPEQARELTSALLGLARLNCDPGEAFCEISFQIALADDGADQLLLASVAWGLAMFRRCTPEQWAALLALYRAQPLPSSSAGNSSTEVKPGRHIPTRWLTAYTLMLEQYGCQPSRVEGVAGAVTGAAHAAPSTAAQQANGVPSLTCEVEGVADLGMPGAAAGQTVARLPDGLLQQGLLLQQQLLERHRPAQAVRRQTMYPATLEALRQLCAGRYEVNEHYLVQDPHSGASVLLDLAVPELRFGVRICQSSDVVRTTGLPLGHVTVLQRLGRLTGWEVALLPPPMLLVTHHDSPDQMVAAAGAVLLNQGGLQQLLAAGRP